MTTDELKYKLDTMPNMTEITLYSPRRKIVITCKIESDIPVYTTTIYKKKQNEELRNFTTEKSKRIIAEVSKFAYFSLISE